MGRHARHLGSSASLHSNLGGHARAGLNHLPLFPPALVAQRAASQPLAAVAA